MHTIGQIDIVRVLFHRDRPHWTMNLKDDKDLLKLSRWKCKGVVTEPAMRTMLDSKRLALSKNETLPNTDLRKSERKKKEQEESEQSNDEPSASTRSGKRTNKASSKNSTKGRKGRSERRWIV